MEPSEVIAEVQADAAAEVAARVGEVSAVGDQIIASEVAAVGDVLEEHAELSEERHEEILEDTTWLKDQLASFSMMLQALSTQLQALQTMMLSKLEALEAKLLRDSSPSTPQQEAPPEAVAAI